MSSRMTLREALHILRFESEPLRAITATEKENERYARANTICTAALHYIESVEAFECTSSKDPKMLSALLMTRLSTWERFQKLQSEDWAGALAATKA